MSLNRDIETQRQAGAESAWRAVEWKPSMPVTVLWTIFGAALTILGFLIFLFVYAAFHSSEPPNSVTLNLLLLLLLVIGVLVLHEALHGAAAMVYGAKPKFGAALLHRFVPVLYCTTPGHYFTRRQFAIFALMPLVVISTLGVILLAVTPWGLMLIAPLAVNFGGAVGDIWFIGLLLQQPPGTLVEDQRDGVRFHYPPGRRDDLRAAERGY
jgi:hypothetical protein